MPHPRPAFRNTQDYYVYLLGVTLVSFPFHGLHSRDDLLFLRDELPYYSGHLSCPVKMDSNNSSARGSFD